MTGWQWSTAGILKQQRITSTRSLLSVLLNPLLFALPRSSLSSEFLLVNSTRWSNMSSLKKRIDGPSYLKKEEELGTDERIGEKKSISFYEASLYASTSRFFIPALNFTKPGRLQREAITFTMDNKNWWWQSLYNNIAEMYSKLVNNGNSRSP